MTRPPSSPRGWAAVVLAPLWWPWQAIGEARWRRTQRAVRLPAIARHEDATHRERAEEST